MIEKVETVIIGGGQAGLAASYHLQRRGGEHVVLEKAAQAGNAWRNDRWDSFTLLTPNWSFQLPGAEYAGEAPNGFMGREEVVRAFEQYVERYQLPVRFGVGATSVEAIPGGNDFIVQTTAGLLRADNVIIATGLYQRPKIPYFSQRASSRIHQLPAGQYRNPGELPPGAVLVVGSGQSGCQVAEELSLAGRRVYLCVSSAGRAMRRYRGKDVFEWLSLTGFLDRTVEKLAFPRTRYHANPQLSGRDGGRNLNLHQFARDGVRLLGKLQSMSEETAWLAEDLHRNLAKADKFESDLAQMIDAYITKTGMDAPQEDLPALRDGFAVEQEVELDLGPAKITTIIWAMGYQFDFNLVRLPVFDRDGFPIQKRGITNHPGLYFLGLPWLYKQKSGLLMGVGEDAEYITTTIAEAKDRIGLRAYNLAPAGERGRRSGLF